MNSTKSAPKRKPPAGLYLLLFFLFFLGIGALWGGGLLILDPTGSMLKMPLSNLNQAPFPNYLIPGIVLFIGLGVFPLVIFFALLARPSWSWANAFNLFKDQFWALGFAFYQGLILIIWMDFQIMWIGYGHFIQTAYAWLGVVIVILAALPSVKSHYRQ